MKENVKLYDLVDISRPAAVLTEALTLCEEIAPDYKAALFEETFGQVARLFAGKYPGYRASNTRYHDFEHTCAVTLATARLLYGARETGCDFTAEDINVAVFPALFHDLGLIQAKEDRNGTGAKYTIGHEERSILFLRKHFEDGGLTEVELSACESCIRCTILAKDPRDVHFEDETKRVLGQMLGTADLLAQMADRFYLEKLLLLFEEFQEACLPGYDTAVDLLLKTRAFYEKVAIQRFSEGLGDVQRYMVGYFRRRWNLSQDLYAGAVQKNIEYLDDVLKECNGELECSLNFFRRGGWLSASNDR